MYLWSSADVFKCTVMMTDMKRWSDFNKIYLSFFPDHDHLPSRSAFGACSLALGAALEIEVCAVQKPQELQEVQKPQDSSKL